MDWAANKATLESAKSTRRSERGAVGFTRQSVTSGSQAPNPPPLTPERPRTGQAVESDAVHAPDGWAVYMLRCCDGSLYTGATNDLPARLKRHQAGKGAAYTRSRLPVRLVFSEPAADRSGALRREAALKRLTRDEKLALVSNRRRRVRRRTR